MNARTILIVDDEPHVTYIVSRKLEQSGLKVLTACDGQEGYELSCLHRPDCIITDYQMPVLDGFEMCVKLNENPQTAHIPVLMLTARGHKISPSELTRTNIRGMIGKPFSAREILATVTDLMAPGAAAAEAGAAKINPGAKPA